MLDSHLRRYIDPASDRVGKICAQLGVSANAVTYGGAALGAGAFVAIANSAFTLGLVLILLNRLADGLDGAVARAKGTTDLGGVLDIVFDFIFYSLIPLGFALADSANAVAACFLVVSFMGTGSSFLAFAIMAEKRGIETTIRGHKSLYYLGGLTEGTETIFALVLMCLFPAWFSVIAVVFGCLCWLTTATRIYWAHKAFNGNERNE